LVQELLAPLVSGLSTRQPAETHAWLSERLRILAIQTGETGPIDQILAGFDAALWDLAARRAGQPLYRFLGADRPSVPVYASGINPDGAFETVKVAEAAGHDAFKLKIGFDPERDRANVADVRAHLGADRELMVDANQAWDARTALAQADWLNAHDLAWLEEPLAADTPADVWHQLRHAIHVPLAAGENIRGLEAFRAVMAAGHLGVVQPDLAKWGGVSGMVAVAAACRDRGLRFCPHYLGGGIGLAASAHVLAAVGGDGRLEVDVNPNPLRTDPLADWDDVRAGAWRLPETHGIGIAPARIRETIARYETPVA
jgi:L-alanine-DL-glutamate epimerase-like enolase superfamily enzyme